MHDATHSDAVVEWNCDILEDDAKLDAQMQHAHCARLYAAYAANVSDTCMLNEQTETGRMLLPMCDCQQRSDSLFEC